MDARRQKAFDLSIDSAKLLITLAAAILTLTLTLATNVSERLGLLKAAWVFYFLSILVGVWRLSAFAVEMERAAGADREPSTRSVGVRTPTVAQASAFVLGTLLVLYYGLTAT
jgi:hypothetical protein